MIDTELGDGVNIDPPVFHHLGSKAGYMEVTYGNLHELFLIDKANDEPIKNTDISIVIDGNRTIAAKSDDAGKIKFDLLTVQHISNKSVFTRNEYTNYTFNIANHKPYNIATSQLKNTDTLFLNDVSSIYDNKLSNIYISPDMINEYFVINGLQGNETIDVIDINGHKLLNLQANSERATISTANFTQGTYFVRINNGKALKIIVKK